MKEERFEKVVEWGEDNPLPYVIGTWFTGYFFAVFVFGSDIQKKLLWSIVLTILWIVLNYLFFKSRSKVYWRKIK